MALTRMAEHVGRVLGGRYRLLAPLGSGASADVFLADDVRLRRRVAVKVLHAALADDESFLRRFRAEARAAAVLSHPGILAVFDWSGDEGDAPYLVTEYLGGGSLRTMFDAGQRLSASQALVVGLEAARALDHAHRQGFVHRDIKPANLLFDEEGRLRVADFGLARALAEAAWTEPTGAVLGTARYASPEQAQGVALDGRSDVYSLALVIIEAVTGRVPFTADTTIGTLMARLDRSIDVPEELGPLGGIVGRAGQLEPAARPDAAELAQGLVQAAEQLPRPAPLPLGRGPMMGAPRDPRDATLQAPSSLIPPPPTSAGPIGAGSLAPAGAAPGPDTPLAAPAGGSAASDAPATPDDVATVGAAAVLVAPSPPPRSATPAGEVPRHPRPAEGPLPDDVRTVLRRDGVAPGTSRAGRPPWWVRLVPARYPPWPASRWIVVGVAAAALVAAVGGATAYLASRADAHVIPGGLIGASESDISALVGDYGWHVETRTTRRDGTDPGEVVDTEPEPGTELAEGETLVVVVSLGPSLVDVPEDLAGLPQAEAEQRLKAKGVELVPEIVGDYDEDVEAGIVLGLDDGTPRRLPKGATVRLVVSAGPAPRTVPDVIGESFGEAVDEIEDEGLTVERVVDSRSNHPPGTVIRTDPTAGTGVDRGSTVQVVVAGTGIAVVPDVVGDSLDQATRQLEREGLTVAGVVGNPGGRVFATNPPEGFEVPAGTAVTLYVI